MAAGKKGLGLLIAGIICVAGGVAAVFSSILPMMKHIQPLATMESPGEVAFEAEKSGVYTLWHDHHTIHEGRTITNPHQPPADLRYEAMRQSDGVVLTLTPGSFDESLDMGERKAVLVGQFDVNVAGTYVLRVDNPTNDRRVFSITRGEFMSTIITTLILFLLGIVLGLGGLIMLIIGLVRLLSKPRPEPPHVSPPPEQLPPLPSPPS